MASKNCAICGNNSGMWPLCKECFKLRDEGKIKKCEECGVWHYIDKPCNCKKAITIEVDKPLNKCLICGTEANNFLFCKDCYYKYKNKVLLLKVTKCTEFKIMHEEYEGKYTCIDGHIVKSKSEMLIDNYLFSKKISHAYERAFPIDEDPKHDLHPDFYLPELNVYIEHWGYDEENKPYTETKKYKIEQYEKKQITLICTNENDITDIETNLKRKLDYFKEKTINFND